MIIFINYPPIKFGNLELTLKQRIIICLVWLTPFLILLMYQKYERGDFNKNKQQLYVYEGVCNKAIKDNNIPLFYSSLDSVKKYKELYKQDKTN